MALPTMQNVVIRGALQQVSIAYRNPEYVGDEVFPIINGLNTQTRILKYDRGPWFRVAADYRAEGTTAKRGDYTLQTMNLDPKQIAIGKSVTDELFFVSNEPGNLPLQPIQEALIYCADQIDIFKEKLIAKTIFGVEDSSVVWADGVLHGEDKQGAWADTTSANTFITDVLAAKKVVLRKTGMLPNTMLIDYNTFTALQNTAPILDRIKYTQTGVITADLIAALLQLDKVIVGKAIYTSDLEKATGNDTMTTVLNIWEYNATKGSAFLFYRPAAPGLRTPSPGYQYRLLWDGAWRRSISYREEWNHQTVYEVSERIQIAPAGLDLGYLWRDTILT